MKQQVIEGQKASKYSISSFTTYFSIPDDVHIWSPKKSKEGSPHQFDIIPFQVGDNFPDKVYKGQSPSEGDWAQVMDVHVHRNIGPDNVTVLCPKHSYKSGTAKGDKAGCPVCEYLAERQAEFPNDPDKRKEIWAELKPSRRTMYNVVVRDNGEEEEKGVQVWEVAYFYMQKDLSSLSEDTGDGVIVYSDVDEGKKIYFKIVDKGTESAPEYTSHMFKERLNPKTRKPYVISDEEIDQAHCLENFLTLMSYDEIQELLNGASAEKEEEPEEEVVERGSRLRSRGKKEEVEQELPEMETGEWDGKSCPSGHEFGRDCVNQPECDDCLQEIYDVCAVLKEQLEEEDRKKKKFERKRTGK